MSNRHDMKVDRMPSRRRRFVKSMPSLEREASGEPSRGGGRGSAPNTPPPQRDAFGQTWPQDSWAEPEPAQAAYNVPKQTFAPKSWPRDDAFAEQTPPSTARRAPPPEDGGEGPSYTPPPRPTPRASNSYSSVVRWLRLGLPLMAVAILVGVFYSGRTNSGAQEIIFRTGQFAALQGGLRLTNPRFTGATSAGEPFMVRANWAEPDGPDPNRIALNTVVGDIVQANGEKLTIQAAEGELAPKAQTVMLTGGVTLRTTDGYTATTQTLRANAKQRSMVSDGQVHAHGPLGELTAGAIRVEEGAGGIMYFEKGVRVVLHKISESRARGY